MGEEASQGFRVLMVDLLVKDHRINPDQPGRHYKLGEFFTIGDLEDRGRYPAPPNVWHWVAAKIVEPVGWPTWTVVSPITDHAPRGRNPHGYVQPGHVVTEWHFPSHVAVDALVAAGHLEPIEANQAEETTQGEEPNG